MNRPGQLQHPTRFNLLPTPIASTTDDLPCNSHMPNFALASAVEMLETDC
jgi:hypothetical protein